MTPREHSPKLQELQWDFGAGNAEFVPKLIKEVAKYAFPLCMYTWHNVHHTEGRAERVV